jgi:hypothetical protein
MKQSKTIHIRISDEILAKIRMWYASESSVPLSIHQQVAVFVRVASLSLPSPTPEQLTRFTNRLNDGAINAPIDIVDSNIAEAIRHFTDKQKEGE